MVLTAFFIFQMRQFNAVVLLLQIAFNVKTTIDMDCTKAHGRNL
jgi:hypothetical protein